MTTDEIMKMLPTLPKMHSAERSNNLDIRLHSGDKVTGENSAFCNDPLPCERLPPPPPPPPPEAAPLTSDSVFCSNSSSKGVPAVDVGNEVLMNSAGREATVAFTCRNNPWRSNVELATLSMIHSGKHIHFRGGGSCLKLLSCTLCLFSFGDFKYYFYFTPTSTPQSVSHPSSSATYDVMKLCGAATASQRT